MTWRPILSALPSNNRLGFFLRSSWLENPCQHNARKVAHVRTQKFKILVSFSCLKDAVRTVWEVGTRILDSEIKYLKLNMVRVKCAWKWREFKPSSEFKWCWETLIQLKRGLLTSTVYNEPWCNEAWTCDTVFTYAPVDTVWYRPIYVTPVPQYRTLVSILLQ